MGSFGEHRHSFDSGSLLPLDASKVDEDPSAAPEGLEELLSSLQAVVAATDDEGASHGKRTAKALPPLPELLLRGDEIEILLVPLDKAKEGQKLFHDHVEDPPKRAVPTRTTVLPSSTAQT